MRIVTETRYCDGCGRGPAEGSNVPYLGWVAIDVHRIGFIGSKPLKADLCFDCSDRVWASIPLT